MHGIGIGARGPDHVMPNRARPYALSLKSNWRCGARDLLDFGCSPIHPQAGQEAPQAQLNQSVPLTTMKRLYVILQ